MKLHIGCGNKFLPGYIHVDVMKYEHVDYIANANNLDMIKDNSVDEIYACHILEHFSRFDNEKVLSEWNRVLKRGAILRISVPNFEAIVHEYIEGEKALDNIIGLLYGGQNYDYNYHFQVFDFSQIEKILINTGFENVEKYDWREFLPIDFDDYSRAYLPHMDFANGRLMSLNIVCIKA